MALLGGVVEIQAVYAAGMLVSRRRKFVYWKNKKEKIITMNNYHMLRVRIGENDGISLIDHNRSSPFIGLF